MSFLKQTFAGAVLMFAAVVAFAHTSAISTTPKSGSVLDASPPAISITFKEAARLTAVSVVHLDSKAQRKLTFAPSGNATEFKIDDPQLPAGKSVVSWTALSKDGHVVKGAIVLTVKAPATQPK